MRTDFEGLVELYYPSLYRFAFSLTGRESEACDLTQQTFYVWAKKGHQLQNISKVKNWLFTTLHREFLQERRKAARSTSVDLEQLLEELPEVLSDHFCSCDGQAVLEAVLHLDRLYQAPIALFYLEEYSYLEIAQVLQIPIGTVKSRISRGILQLQRLLADPVSPLGERKSL
jgi:RNA polymerase sigma-70 factor (ECF subfamily)